MEQMRGLMAGRTVLVTGGTGGIGRATALGLAAMGAHLAITGRDRGRAESAAREIRAAGGGQVDVFVADLSAQSEVRALADEALRRLPRIDVLVNNAGGTGTPGMSPLTGLSAPLPSTISRRSCSLVSRVGSCFTV
jgi:NAD(P)-dependent dehydrogenase (short-subunit alcohol dehydrogenase family)